MLEDNVLDHEIENWRGFASVLYTEDRDMFTKMMSEAKAYAKAAKNAPTKEQAEALFMSLIFQQQRMISSLLATLEKLEKKKNEPPQDS